MKSVFVCMNFFLFSNCLFAQFDNGKSSINAPMNPSSSGLNVPSKFDFGKPKIATPDFPDLNSPTKKSVDLVKKNDFVNPNIDRVKKLNGEGQDRPVFKSDNFLGEFKNKGKFVRLVCRDYGDVDGDRVRIYQNDVIIEEDILLEGNYKEIKINLVNGFNKIDIQALNEGYYAPNTAEFKLYDDKGVLISSNQWNLTIGVKAKLVIVKE